MRVAYRKLRRSGAKAMNSKPVGASASSATLLETLNVEEPEQRQRRILLAEDDLEMRRCLAELLRRAGYEVIEAASGFEAMDYIAARLVESGVVDVGVVVSDVRMPGVDGLHVLAALQGHEPVPAVILITAFGTPETHAEAQRRGALTVFDKPFDIDELLALVKSVLPRDEPAQRRSA